MSDSAEVDRGQSARNIGYKGAEYMEMSFVVEVMSVNIIGM